MAITSLERYICIAAASGVFAFFAGRQASRPSVPEVLRARAIELTDTQGKTVAEWRADENGNAVLAMRNGKGEVGVYISTAGGGALRLYNYETKEQPGIELVSGPFGGECNIKNRSGQVVARMTASQRDLGGEAVLYDASGLPTTLITRAPGGTGQIATLKANAGVWASPEK